MRDGGPRLPGVPAGLPTRDYGWLAPAGRAWLRATGWRVEGVLPADPRLVVAVAPHSSNLDFVHVAAAIFALGLRVSFVGKHTLFRGPLGRFMRWMGGVPVDRGNPGGIVHATAAALAGAPAMWLGVAPEGTRSAGARFKSGFVRIAREARVPILPISIDHARRVIAVHPLHRPGPDVDADVAAIRALLLAHGRRRGAPAGRP